MIGRDGQTDRPTSSTRRWCRTSCPYIQSRMTDMAWREMGGGSHNFNVPVDVTLPKTSWKYGDDAAKINL